MKIMLLDVKRSKIKYNSFLVTNCPVLNCPRIKVSDTQFCPRPNCPGT